MTAEQSNPNDEASGWQRPEGCICPSTAGDGSDYYNPRDCPVHGVGPAPEVLSEPTPSGERGDLPHINCTHYAHLANTDHDPHVHLFEHAGEEYDAWCQGRPFPAPSPSPVPEAGDRARGRFLIAVDRLLAARRTTGDET